MKKFFKNIFDEELTFVIIISLLLGCFIGVFMQTPYSLGIKTTFHNLYIKLNPDTQKDSKTIIIDKASESLDKLPQKDIFEQPEKKENKFILFIKNVFKTEKTQQKTINDKNFD